MQKLLSLALDFPNTLRILKFRSSINVVNRIFVGVQKAQHVAAACNIERWGCYDVESEWKVPQTRRTYWLNSHFILAVRIRYPYFLCRAAYAIKQIKLKGFGLSRVVLSLPLFAFMWKQIIFWIVTVAHAVVVIQHKIYVNFSFRMCYKKNKSKVALRNQHFITFSRGCTYLMYLTVLECFFE